MKEISVGRNIVSFNSAINACARGKQWQCALEVLQEMRTEFIKPNVITYNASISACEKGLQWKKALQLLSEMKTEGVQPTVITYNASISACEKGLQWEKALQLFTEMKTEGVQPDVITYNASISACEKGLQWKKALQLLSEMKSEAIESNVITYSAAIIACENASRCKEAGLLYREACASNLFKHWEGDRKNELIDFHDYPLAVAKVALRTILYDYRSMPPKKNPQVIVGVGNHSEANVVLKPGLLAMLKTEFQGRMRARVSKTNPGRLVISRNSIAQWVEKL